MSAIARLAALDRAAAWLATADDAAVREVGLDLSNWLTCGDGSLEDALGLKASSGSRTWRTTAALEARDEHLRAAASTFNLGATEISTRLARYVGTAWPRDRVAATCPPRLDGKPEALFWMALRAWPRPVGLRQIQKTLRTELGLFSSRDVADTDRDDKTGDEP
ncbi:MAG: hypothetical protein EOS36_07335 [Mesorhizobium sp.]|uniref:hypothetical protein n=1 Tax=Mesorhizobium sp. TaxID=1871066 RepID=UPI000FE72C78|nr:hypothetical protein [Mesorhizobium sp.]RWD65507.1 MAG: hypothetical protein EOS36_07335 [Mesorhizobium sp.]